MKQLKHLDLQRSSTIILRLAIIGYGLVILLVTTLLSRGVYREWPEIFPDTVYLRYPAVIILAIAALSLLAALYQGMKLLNFVDRSIAFSHRSVNALNNIKYAALIMSADLACGLPFVYMIAQKDDAPGLILFGAAIASAPFAVAVAAAVAARLLKHVIAIKTENDLTV